MTSIFSGCSTAIQRFSHGWHPESGFIRNRWDTYSEHTMLPHGDHGSSSHHIPAESWYAWKRDWIDYDGFHYLSSGTPLFTHQYSQRGSTIVAAARSAARRLITSKTRYSRPVPTGNFASISARNS
jgi:hypothetical protein